VVQTQVVPGPQFGEVHPARKTLTLSAFWVPCGAGRRSKMGSKARGAKALATSAKANKPLGINRFLIAASLVSSFKCARSDRATDKGIVGKRLLSPARKRVFKGVK
jgi:hypothetical protein